MENKGSVASLPVDEPRDLEPVGVVERTIPMVSYWMGRPLTELSRDELLVVIDHLGREIQTARAIATATHEIHELARKARERGLY